MRRAVRCLVGRGLFLYPAALYFSSELLTDLLILDKATLPEWNLNALFAQVAG
jgi:hypothetical protein